MSCKKLLDDQEIKRCCADSISIPNDKLCFSQFLTISFEMEKQSLRHVGVTDNKELKLQEYSIIINTCTLQI